ncbi:MAG: hypothetical protein IPP66_13630 [Anaerolineales bacterium]|nr:hypothetical protein [Anaerolineales bacterium]
MEKSNEVYDVPQCPSCGKAHKYRMIVLRSTVLFGASNADMQKEKRVRRIFICPKTGVKFEGVVVLLDDPKNKIASVKVEGLVEEKK